MHAEKTNSPLGECSFCALRNLPKFCEMIQASACSVITDNDDIYTVTWQPNVKGLKLTMLNGFPPIEMTKFFNETEPEKMKSIFEKMAREVVAEKQR